LVFQIHDEREETPPRARHRGPVPHWPRTCGKRARNPWLTRASNQGRFPVSLRTCCLWNV